MAAEKYTNTDARFNARATSAAAFTSTYSLAPTVEQEVLEAVVGAQQAAASLLSSCPYTFPVVTLLNGMFAKEGLFELQTRAVRGESCLMARYVVVALDAEALGACKALKVEHCVLAQADTRGGGDLLSEQVGGWVDRWASGLVEEWLLCPC